MASSQHLSRPASLALRNRGWNCEIWKGLLCALVTLDMVDCFQFPRNGEKTGHLDPNRLADPGNLSTDVVDLKRVAGQPIL